MACCRSLDLSSLLFVEAVLLVELVNTSACVNQLLLARKIGVTLVANFHLDDVGVFGCTRLERSATSTYNSRLMIIRMYTLFHFAHLAVFLKDFTFVLFYSTASKKNSQAFLAEYCKPFATCKNIYLFKICH